MVGKFASFVVRIFQIAFAACVLGFSIAAIRWQHRNSVPATNAYAMFTGAFGLLAGLLGLMAVVIDALAGVFMLTIDCLATVFFLAGGIVSFEMHIIQSNVFRLMRIRRMQFVLVE